jgi:AcrR family transcriptional regulator
VEDCVPYRETDATRAARDRRRVALVAAGVEVVAERGFAGATVQAVAGRAGLSASSVYTYFPARADLLTAVFREIASVELGHVREAAEPRPDDAPATAAQARLTRVVDTFARRALRRRRLARALLLEPADPAVEAERTLFAREYADLFGAIAAAGVASGELPAQDTRIVGAALVGAVASALTSPLAPLGEGVDPDALVATIVGFCLRGVVGAAA